MKLLEYDAVRYRAQYSIAGTDIKYNKTAIINERENCPSQPIVNKLSVKPKQKLCVVSLSLRGSQ